MSQHHYFVAYSHGRGFGSTEVYLDEPITDWSGVLKTTAVVARNIRAAAPGLEFNDGDVVILNWKPLGSSDAET